jgi:Zn-dependent protease
VASDRRIVASHDDDQRAALTRLIRIARISGATVYVHWSVLVVTAVMLISAIENAGSTVLAVVCYLGVLLLHEWGHLVAAHRVGSVVWSIELYPLHGVTRYAETSSQYDECVVAWGGVLVQLAVAVPLILWATFVGFTGIAAVDAVIAMFGYFSAVIAVYNLLPFGRLDGATAWRIVPLLWRRKTGNKIRAGSAQDKRRTRKGDWVH